MKTRVKKFWSWLNNRETPIGKAWRTFYQVFIGTFSVSFLGFLNELTEWASGEGHIPPFSILGRAAVAAISAACGSVVTMIQNFREDKVAGRT